VILRCTAKAQTLLGRPAPGQAAPAPSAEDWYANLLWIERRKCLLVTHAGTLFSVFVPDVRAAQLRPPGPLLVQQIRRALSAEGLPVDALGLLDNEPLMIAKTADRSVLGCMNDLTFVCEIEVESAGGLARLDLAHLHHRLHRNINSARDYVPPIDLVLAHPGGPLPLSRWRGGAQPPNSLIRRTCPSPFDRC
jgi:hypothetical protein